MAKKLQAKTELPVLPVVVLTADTLMSLLDRVSKLENQVKAVADEAQDKFDYLVEHIPRFEKNGKVVVNALTEEEAMDVVLVTEDVESKSA